GHIGDGGRVGGPHAQMPQAFGRYSVVDDAAAQVTLPARAPGTAHCALADSQNVGRCDLDEPSARGKLCPTSGGILFVVDDGRMKVRDATASACETCDRENHAGEVVNVRVHDVVAPLPQKPGEADGKGGDYRATPAGSPRSTNGPSRPLRTRKSDRPRRPLSDSASSMVLSSAPPRISRPKTCSTRSIPLSMS